MPSKYWFGVIENLIKFFIYARRAKSNEFLSIIVSVDERKDRITEAINKRECAKCDGTGWKTIREFQIEEAVDIIDDVVADVDYWTTGRGAFLSKCAAGIDFLNLPEID